MTKHQNTSSFESRNFDKKQIPLFIKVTETRVFVFNPVLVYQNRYDRLAVQICLRVNRLNPCYAWFSHVQGWISGSLGHSKFAATDYISPPKKTAPSLVWHFSEILYSFKLTLLRNEARSIFFSLLNYLQGSDVHRQKNKKLGIIRSLSYKQWNVDVDFVKIVFFIKLIEDIRIMYFDCFIRLYLLQYEYQAKYNCIKALLKYFTTSTIRVFYSTLGAGRQRLGRPLSRIWNS